MRKAMFLAGPDDPREPLHILDHQCEIFGGAGTDVQCGPKSGGVEFLRGSLLRWSSQPRDHRGGDCLIRPPSVVRGRYP